MTQTARHQASRTTLLGEQAEPSGVLKRYRRFSYLIALTDGLSVVTAMLTAYVLRFGFAPVPTDFSLLITSAPLVLVGIFSAFRLYSVQLIGPAEEFRRVIAGVSTTIAAMALFGFWSHIPYSRLWLGVTWIVTPLLCLVTRRRWRRAMWRMRATGDLAYRTLIVGANEEATRALKAFRSPALGFRPVAIASTEMGNGQRPPTLDVSLITIGTEVVENIEDLRRVIRQLAVDCVFVASSAVSPDIMAVISKAARLEGAEVRMSVNMPHILTTRLTIQPLDRLTIVSLKSAQLSGTQAAAKRTVDILGATFGLLVTLPLCAGIAAAIRISSGSPVLYRQPRVGRQGRPFTLLKFRTMIQGADAMVLDLQDRNEADGPLFKIRQDPRTTSVGRWLRRWSLDELPQLLNVLRGEMSLVGPRPPLQQEVACYEDWHSSRLEVAPGITGLWQVEGRAELLFDESVQRDIFYIENWSLSYDLFIIAKTVPALLSRRGAY